MLDFLLSAFELLEPFLLVAGGALATGVGTGLNERRKRKYELQDRATNEQQQRDERKRAMLLTILDRRSEYIRDQQHAPSHMRAELLDASVHSMLNTAAATGDAEVIRAVEYFVSEQFDDEGELLDLVSRRVAALESPPKQLRWWQRRRGQVEA